MSMEIQLRQIEAEDLPQLRDWRNDDRLRHNFREYRLLNMVNQRDWLDHISRSREVEMFGIEAMTDGGISIDSDGVTIKAAGRVLVGACGLCNINWVNRTAEVSLYVTPDCRDRDIISLQAREILRQKAFGEFNLRRLCTEVYGFRTERIALLELCGYTHEGTLRKHIFKRGQYHDSLVYGLLREET